MSSASPSIAVIGTGAVGSYYGARLAEAGYDVRFLVRRDFDVVRREGIRVTSHLGDLTLAAPRIGPSAEELAQDGPVDWLLVALKAHEVDRLAAMAGPLLGANTRILAVVNGFGVEDDIAETVHRYGIFGGLGYIGVGQPRAGRIMHREFGALEIGHREDDEEAVADAVALWAPTRVAARPADCLRRARWVKMLWDIPFNGLSIIGAGANVDFILGAQPLADFARRVMTEVAEVANADLAAHGLPTIDDPDAACDRAMRLMGTTENYIPGAGVDLVRQQPLEVDAMFARPVRRAEELGIDVPATAFLAALVRRLNPAATF